MSPPPPSRTGSGDAPPETRIPSQRREPFVVQRVAVDEYRGVLGSALATASPPVGGVATDVVPLTFFMVAGWPTLVAHGTSYLEGLGAFGAPLTLVRYSLEAERHLLIGEEIHTEVTVASRARGPAGGSFVAFDHTATSATDGSVLARQRSTVLVQGLASETRDREVVRRTSIEKHGGPARTEMRLPAGLPAAFAGASGDLNPIHLDRRASAAAGFDELVVHGMCLLALALACLPDGAAADQPGLGSSLSCQFGAPAHPGDDLVVSAWDATSEEGVHGWSFNAATGRSVALKNGLLVPRRVAAASTVARHA